VIHQSIQGVRHKLLAFEAFLDKHPEYHQKVVLIQVALQTSEENEAHGGVADVVARINSRFSTLTYQPVVFLHTEDLSFSQYLALLTVADAFLVTSMREGMALRTHEFVVCQEERHRPLILSEVCRPVALKLFLLNVRSLLVRTATAVSVLALQ
jgi:trehalose 6-phosphate synthase/phosphatase